MRRLVKLGLWGAMAGAAALFLLLAWLHLRYPVERDYIEGVMMDHALRVARGQNMYVEPTLDFVTLAYMPVFAALTALLVKLFGAAFWEPRLISTLSTLGITLLAGLALHRETRSWTLAVAAGGVFLAGYGFAGGGHYDLSRPDSLMLLLSLAAFTVLRASTSPRATVGAALLLVVAFFTKQHAVWFGLAACAHLFVNERPRFARFAATWAAGCLGGYLLLELWLGPWFSYYTWDVPRHWSTLSWVRFQRYLGLGLLGTIGGLTIPAILSLALPAPPWKERSGIWMWMAAGAVCTGLMATLDPSAWHHVFIPTMMAFSILGPLSLERLMRALAPAAAPGPRHDHAIATALLLLQLVPLVYSVHGMLPRRHAAEARADFEGFLAKLPGRVIVICHGFYAGNAGKGMSCQIIAIGDVVRAPGNRLERRDPRYMEKIIAPLLSGPGRPTLVGDYSFEKLGAPWNALEGSYRVAADLGDRFAALAPTGGERGFPRYVYVPVEPGARGAAADSAATGEAPARP